MLLRNSQCNAYYVHLANNCEVFKFRNTRNFVFRKLYIAYIKARPDIHVAHMAPTWVLSAPGRSYVVPTNLAMKGL